MGRLLKYSKMALSENSVLLHPMVLLIIIPFLNGYFIGGIPVYPIFKHTQMRNLIGSSCRWQIVSSAVWNSLRRACCRTSVFFHQEIEWASWVAVGVAVATVGDVDLGMFHLQLIIFQDDDRFDLFSMENLRSVSLCSSLPHKNSRTT